MSSPHGPIAASDIDGAKGKGGWWGWSDEKAAFEWLFWAGRVTTASRRGFERLYDLPERVLPRKVLDMPEPTPTGRASPVAAPCRPRARRRHGRRPARLFPPVAGRYEGPCRGTGRSRRTAARRRGRVEEPGLSVQRRAISAQGRGARPAGALRSARLGAGAHRAPVRFPLPHRDLHAGRQAPVRLLRPAVPAGRQDRREGRSSRRPAGRRFARWWRPMASPARRPKLLANSPPSWS